MLRCTFAHELRQVLRVTHSDHIVRGALFGHFTAIKSGSDLAAQVGFTKADRETRVTQFGGMTRHRVQSAPYTGAQTIQAQIRETENG
jgi:hypothetical protein